MSKYINNTNKKSKCELILITTSLVLDKVSNLDLSGVEHYIFVVVNIVDEGTIALVLRPVVRPLIESTKLISVQIKLFQLVLENRRCFDCLRGSDSESLRRNHSLVEVVGTSASVDFDTVIGRKTSL